MPSPIAPWPRGFFSLLLVLAACGGGTPASERPVLSTADETPPRRARTCSVVQRADLGPRADLERPALTRSPRGDLTVAWIGRDDRGRSVRVGELPPSLQPSGPPATLGASAEGMPLAPAVASCGQVTWVAWQHQEPRGGDDTIRLAGLDAGGAVIAGPEVAGRGETPALGCAGARAVLIWSRRQEGIQDLYLRWIGPTGELGDRHRISGDTDMAEAPSVACAEGRCAVAWSDRRFTYAEIYAALLAGPGEAPGPPIRLSDHNQTTSGSGGAYAPAVATDDGRSFIVAWHDSRSHDEHEIYAATLSAGGAGGAEHRITRTPATSDDAATGRCSGGAAVAWRDRRRGPPAVMFAALDDRGRRRSSAIALSQSPIESSAPALTCLPGPTFAVAWTAASDEGGRVQLALVRCQ